MKAAVASSPMWLLSDAISCVKIIISTPSRCSPYRSNPAFRRPRRQSPSPSGSGPRSLSCSVAATVCVASIVQSFYSVRVPSPAGELFVLAPWPWPEGGRIARPLALAPRGRVAPGPWPGPGGGQIRPAPPPPAGLEGRVAPGPPGPGPRGQDRRPPGPWPRGRVAPAPGPG